MDWPLEEINPSSWNSSFKMLRKKVRSHSELDQQENQSRNFFSKKYKIFLTYASLLIY